MISLLRSGVSRCRVALSIFAVSSSALGFVFLFNEVAGAASACQLKEATTEFGRWFESGIELSANMTSQSVESGYDGIYTTLKLLINWKAGTDRTWSVVIRGPDYHVLATFGAEDMEVGASRGRWTGRLPHKKVIVDLMAKDESDVVLEISSGLAFPAESSDVRVFSTQDSIPNWRDLYKDSSATMKRAGDPVGMLAAAAYDVDGIKRSWCCSGVMISSNVFLTNWHCGGSPGMARSTYWKPNICSNTMIDLGWEDGGRSRQYSCEDVIASSEALDIALLRVRPTLGTGGNVGQAPQARLAKTTPSSKKIFIIHHALCRPKLVSSCEINHDPPDDAGSKTIIKHFCDTEPGASGAPLFDLEGNFVGLHHSGFDRDHSCRPIDKLNKATRIEAIVEFVTQKHPALIAKMRFD